MAKVAPSILASDFSRIAEAIASLTQAKADYIHCDVMDGQFVPNISFGAQMIEAIRKETDLPLDVHLMVVEPQTHIENFVKAGADIITFHPETCYHPHKVLMDIRKAGKKAGIVLNPGTSLESVKALISECDMVLVMSVNPGWGGQAFLESVLSKVEALKQLREQYGYTYEIEIDGGINEKTAQMAIRSGVDVLVAGSSVFQAKDIKQAIDALR